MDFSPTCNFILFIFAVPVILISRKHHLIKSELFCFEFKFFESVDIWSYNNVGYLRWFSIMDIIRDKYFLT